MADGSRESDDRASETGDVIPPQAEKRPLFFWVMVVAVGLYLAVRMVEGAMCVAAWWGWGSCPWGG